MHGRIKTRSTSEQERIKKQEREVKVKAYNKAMSLLLEKRRTHAYDQEALDLTTNILRNNPDIITVWNFRREVLLSFKERCDDINTEKLLDKELSLTEETLRTNPKSYGSWHHRGWALNNLGLPNWEKEVMLCKKFLELDERNFHCWDYRRMVTQKAKVSDLSEYTYTLEKISCNFSNYSAWHLRSQLLPKIFPDLENNFPINEVKHKEELELVQNAAFTDPNDQSAWFYQRWLLGLTEPKNHFVGAQVTGTQLIVAVSKNLNQYDNNKFGAHIKIEKNNEEINGKWTNTSGELYSTIWIFDLENELTTSDSIRMQLLENGVINDTLEMNTSFVQKQPNFIPSFSPSLKEVLVEELSNCKVLLEMEPDSKWTNLTSVQLMEFIDAEQYEVEIEKTLKRLIEIDPLRRGYYQDLYSKTVMEFAIRRYFNNQNLNEIPNVKFVVQSKNLTSLYKMQYLLFLEDVDLSCNCLTSEVLSCLHCLFHCQRLNLDNNKIKTLKFLPPMLKLVFLSLYNNEIEEDTAQYLDKFPSLKEIYL